MLAVNLSSNRRAFPALNVSVMHSMRAARRPLFRKAQLRIPRGRALSQTPAHPVPQVCSNSRWRPCFASSPYKRLRNRRSGCLQSGIWRRMSSPPGSFSPLIRLSRSCRVAKFCRPKTSRCPVGQCEEYHAWGVRFSWIIDPVKRTAWEYDAGAEPFRATAMLNAGELAVSTEELFSALNTAP